jgi:alpha-1,2-mannosyltransferase
VGAGRQLAAACPAPRGGASAAARTLAALPATAAAAADHSEGRSGLDLARDTGLLAGTLYPTLIRLERSGLIAAHPPRPANRRDRPSRARGLDGGEPACRRTYRLTDEGMTQAAADPSARPQENWLPALLVAVVTGYVVLARPEGSRLTDLDVYIGAVTGLRDGASLYDFISGNAPFTYPPFAGLVFLALTWIPALPLQLAWTVATIAAVLALAVLSSGITLTPGTRPTQGTRPTSSTRPRPSPSVSLLALVLMLSAPVSSDLKYGQVSIFLAVLVVADVVGECRWQGVLIGLAAAIKLTPLIFIPLLWFGGRKRAAVTATATFAGGAAIAAAVLPGDSWRFWTTEVMHVSRLGYITSVGNQSLNGALLRYDVAAPVRSLCVLMIGGVVVVLALRRAARLAHDGDWLAAVVVVGAAGVVFSPVSWTHHQVWLVLAVLLPVRGHGWLRRTWPLVVLAVMLLPVTALGPPLWSNARLLLAIVTAALLPLGATVAAPNVDEAEQAPTSAPRS